MSETKKIPLSIELSAIIIYPNSPIAQVTIREPGDESGGTDQTYRVPIPKQQHRRLYKAVQRQLSIILNDQRRDERNSHKGS